jgi:hypothetical protein
MTRISSLSNSTWQVRANAAVVAIISADEPEIPAPAGDLEYVSSTKPLFGGPTVAKKKRQRYPANA